MIFNFRYPLFRSYFAVISRLLSKPESRVFIPTFVGTKNIFMGLIPTKSFFDLTNSFIIPTKSFLNLMKSFLVPTKSFFILTKSIFIPTNSFFVLTKSFVNPTKIFMDERNSGFYKTSSIKSINRK